MKSSKRPRAVTPRITLKQRATDRRRSALHEAAHVVVIEHFGGAAHAAVWPRVDAKPNEKTWTGQCTIRVKPDYLGNRQRKSVGIRPFPRKWSAIAGMAGYIAELIDGGLSEPCEVAEQFLFDASTGCLSDSDLSMIEGHLDEVTVEQALGYVSELWPTIEKEADRLLADAVT